MNKELHHMATDNIVYPVHETPHYGMLDKMKGSQLSTAKG